MAIIENATSAYIKDENGDLIQLKGKQYINVLTPDIQLINGIAFFQRTGKDTAIIKGKCTTQSVYSSDNVYFYLPTEIDTCKVAYCSIDNGKTTVTNNGFIKPQYRFGTIPRYVFVSKRGFDRSVQNHEYYFELTDIVYRKMEY